MADIFVSYRRDDRAKVESLVRLLEAEDFTVWWDPAIVPGERFAKVIHRALDAAACVVVVWSEQSVDSLWVQDEAGIGRDRGILVPVSIDGVDPPLGFRQVQTVRLVDWSGRPNDPRILQVLAGVRRMVDASRAKAAIAKVQAQDAAPADETAEFRPTKTRRPRWNTRKKAAALAGAVAAAVILGVVSVSLLLNLYRQAPLPDEGPRIGPIPAERAFVDCPVGCPAMVAVPTGSFQMGSPDEEAQRGNDEGPRHSVTFAKVFAVGKFPVTFDEWDYCHAQGGCDALPWDNNWGRGRQPVINVSWEDARAYVAWLSKHTGKTYRLLSEAEREYITRAGTTTPFWWGGTISTKRANYDATKKYTDEPVGLFRQDTMPVDAFDPNPWGFYQVHGNTWDWVEDCYHDSYEGAPSNGSAWILGDCARRVLRGGSWGSQPRNLRSAARWRLPVDTREPYYGFRVARTCDPDCKQPGLGGN